MTSYGGYHPLNPTNTKEYNCDVLFCCVLLLKSSYAQNLCNSDKRCATLRLKVIDDDGKSLRN